MENEIFSLFAHCIPVKGYSGSIISDLQRNNYQIIPNDLYEILLKYNGLKSINDVKKEFNNKFDETIDEYFEFLIDKEFIHFFQKPELFPPLSKKFFYPFEISNCILDVKKDHGFQLKVIDNLDQLNCKFLEIRCYDDSSDLVFDILRYISEKEYMVKSVNIIISFDEKVKYEELLEKFNIFGRLASIMVYNSPVTKFLKNSSNTKHFIFYSEAKVLSEKSCGCVSNDQFTNNTKSFTESLHHNSCLHKKIAIDIDGNIKNCPSMPQTFGNIKDTTLEEALNHKDFKKYWNINKDQIEVCKDCEFRYICTDCRAYTERTHTNKEGLDTSKPLKCGYSPYTGEWEEWSTNPLKEKAIQYYGMQDLVKKDAS